MNPSREGVPEMTPTKEGVLAIINGLITKIAIEKGGTETKEISVSREESNDEGLYFLEALHVGESEGKKTEYTYTRKGEFPGGISRLTTGIDVVYYDSEGIPCGGTNMAEYKDGEWIEV